MLDGNLSNLGDFIAAGFLTWDDMLNITEAELEGVLKSWSQQWRTHLFQRISKCEERTSKGKHISVFTETLLADFRHRSFNEE